MKTSSDLLLPTLWTCHRLSCYYRDQPYRNCLLSTPPLCRCRRLKFSRSNSIDKTRRKYYRLFDAPAVSSLPLIFSENELFTTFYWDVKDRFLSLTPELKLSRPLLDVSGCFSGWFFNSVCCMNGNSRPAEYFMPITDSNLGSFCREMSTT